MDYISILVSLIIAIVVAVVTSNLSLRGFYRQEVWLRKETKYSQIVNSLNKMQRYYWKVNDEHLGVTDSNESDEEKELREREFMFAKRELEELSTSPLFMVNPEVVEILSDLVVSSNSKTTDEISGDWFSYFDRLGYESQEAKTKIAKIANKDLGIKIKKSN